MHTHTRAHTHTHTKHKHTAHTHALTLNTCTVVTVARLLQVGSLWGGDLDHDGQPNLQGWATLKQRRKRAMFRGVIGVPPCREVAPPLVFRQESPLPPGCAKLGGAAAADAVPQAEPFDAFPDWIRFSIDQVLAGVAAEEEETRAAAPENQSMDFGGRLYMADDLVLTFQLASEGMLGVNQRMHVQQHFELLSRKRCELMAFPGARPTALADPESSVPRGSTAGPSEGGASGEGGGVRGLRPRSGARSQKVAEGLNVSTESGECLHVTWPAWGGQRHTRYAVMALDTGKVEQLVGYWQEKGYPGAGNAVGEKARCVAAAALRKGQGLLLAVEELDEEEYCQHGQVMEERYFARYGEYPPGSYV
jgi:hypothetical protein